MSGAEPSTSFNDDAAIGAFRAAAQAIFRASDELFGMTGPLLESSDRSNRPLVVVERIQSVADQIRTLGASMVGEAELWKTNPPPE